MKLSRAILLGMTCLLFVESTGLADPIKKDEVDYQNYAFKQWYGATLVWRFDRLPQRGTVGKERMPYAGAIYLDRQGGTVNAMTKYDRAFHGNEAKATQFEWRDIALRGTTSWAGHCNGWTAAAIRHAEPRKSVTRNGVVFTPADIKELLAELYVYTDTEFLGGIDVAINPGTLHVVLTNWIGRGKHPIGVETTLGPEVWNYPGHSFTSESIKHDDRHVEVRLELNCVDFLPYEVDKAPTAKKDLYFHYMLTLNEDGEITSGTYFYDSNQIDMLWAPMKPTPGGTEGNEDGNPYIDLDVIVGMWRESVPESVRTSWSVVDPLPEDAVLVADWFRVSPDAEDTRMEYIPELTNEQADNLELAAQATVDVATTQPTANPETIAADVAATPAADVTTDAPASPAADEPATGSADVEVETQATPDDRETEVFKERFSNGLVRLEREVTLDENFNYVNHGQFRQWSEQGALLAEGRFEMGQRVGQWRRAYSAHESQSFSRPAFKGFKGPFTSAATFRNGELHGKWTMHDSQDRMMFEIDFVDGVRNGKLLYFYPNGKKSREIDFRDGYVDGFLREFDEQGQVTVEHKYLDGHYASTKVETFVSTTKKSESELLHPRMTIKSTDDWWNATFADYGITPGEPIRHGAQSVWYDSGQMRFRGQFDQGKATGKFQWWQENGQISRQGEYVDDKQHGQWSWWHSDGSRSVLGSYDHGTPIGRWLFWKPGGKLDQVKELSADGQPVPESQPVDEESLTEPLFPVSAEANSA